MFKKNASLPQVANRPAPPKTEGLPLVGALPKAIRSPLDFLINSRAKYGDIYCIDLGLIEVIALNHARHAQHILRDNVRNYPKKGAMWKAIRSLVGNGLPTSEGDFWLRQRRMMQPHFHQQRLASFTDLMVAAIEEEIANWEPAIATGPFNVAAVMPQITIKVISRTMFSTAISRQKAREVGNALNYALAYMVRQAFANLLPGWIPVPGRRQYRQALQTIDDVIYSVIAEGRQKNSKRNDLLTMLLEMVDKETGEGMSDEQLRDEAVAIFLAGYETTATSLAWTLHLLATHPEAQRKLQAEVDAALQKRRPTFADLRQLPYARMVFQEALRLYSPAWHIPRTAVKEDEIDGYRIPTGANVVVFSYVIHHHPQLWQNPFHFNPERFSPQQTRQHHRFAWIPFGGGQRQCIGKDFAIMEGVLTLAMLMQRYKIEPLPGYEPQPRLLVTLSAQDGILVHLQKRTP